MFMEPGREIPHVFVIPWHLFLSSGCADSGKYDNFWLNCAQMMSVCGFGVLQKHFQVIIDLWEIFVKPNVCKALNPIRTELCHANPSLSVKIAPKLRHFGAKHEQLYGYYGQNSVCAWTQFDVKLFQSLNQLISKVYRTWEGNSTSLCYPMTPVSIKRTRRFGRKMTIVGRIVPK